jgi:type IV pilus assembly protein PilA
MKKMNKGFSLVELIIVIAIMAILAGALAPALIKYINKSRLSGDVQTAQTIASSINAALANESSYDEVADAGSQTGLDLDAVKGLGTNFGAEFESAMGGNLANVKVKAKKDMDGGAISGGFTVDIDAVNNVVKVYIGGLEAYPNPDSKLSEKTNN